MRYLGYLPFEGEIIWLTAAQGGRSSGPPPTPPDQDYAATAFVPPQTVGNGLASFVLRVEDRSAWRSRAFAAWLLEENAGNHLVLAGSTVVVTEGSRTVAFFQVEHVHADPVPLPYACSILMRWLAAWRKKLALKWRRPAELCVPTTTCTQPSRWTIGPTA